MDSSALNKALLARTGGKVGLHQAVEAYAQAIRDSAGVLNVPLSEVDADGTTGRISILLPEQPLAITWTPVSGWGWEVTGREVTGRDAGEGTRRYRVTSEADAAGIVPSPETVAAWIQVISTGDRSGHVDPPEELTAEDGALLDLLVTYGTGYA